MKMNVLGNVIWKSSDGKMQLVVNSKGTWLVIETENQKKAEIKLLQRDGYSLKNGIEKILNHADSASALLGKKPNLVGVSLILSGTNDDREMDLVFQAPGDKLWQHHLTFTEAYAFIDILEKHFGIEVPMTGLNRTV